MDDNRYLLLSPEGDGAMTGGGGAEAPASTESPTQTTVGAADSSVQPATAGDPQGQPNTQPSGRYVSEHEWAQSQRAMQRAAGADKEFSRLKEQGYDSIDSALADLSRLKQLESDPTTGRLLQAFQQTASDTNDADSPAGAQLTKDDVMQLVNEQFATERQRQHTAQHEAASTAETRLLDQTIRDDRLGGIFKDISFDDAYAGKGSKAQETMAWIIEAEMLKQAPRYDNGQAQPITDSAAMTQIIGNAVDRYKEFRAETILQSSQSLGDPTQPIGNVVKPGEEQSYHERREAEAAQGAARLRENVMRYKNAQRGAPVSQSI